MEGATSSAETEAIAHPEEQSFRDSEEFRKRALLISNPAQEPQFQEYIDICLKGGLSISEIYNSIIKVPSVLQSYMAQQGIYSVPEAGSSVRELIRVRVKEVLRVDADVGKELNIDETPQRRAWVPWGRRPTEVEKYQFKIADILTRLFKGEEPDQIAADRNLKIKATDIYAIIGQFRSQGFNMLTGPSIAQQTGPNTFVLDLGPKIFVNGEERDVAAKPKGKVAPKKPEPKVNEQEQREPQPERKPPADYKRTALNGRRPKLPRALRSMLNKGDIDGFIAGCIDSGFKQYQVLRAILTNKNALAKIRVITESKEFFALDSWAQINVRTLFKKHVKAETEQNEKTETEFARKSTPPKTPDKPKPLVKLTPSQRSKLEAILKSEQRPEPGLRKFSLWRRANVLLELANTRSIRDVKSKCGVEESFVRYMERRFNEDKMLVLERGYDLVSGKYKKPKETQTEEIEDEPAQETEPRPPRPRVDPNDISQRKEWRSLGHGFAPELTKDMGLALAKGDIVGFTGLCASKRWKPTRIANAILHSEKAVRHLMSMHEARSKADITAKVRELVASAITNFETAVDEEAEESKSLPPTQSKEAAVRFTRLGFGITLDFAGEQKTALESGNIGRFTQICLAQKGIAHRWTSGRIANAVLNNGPAIQHIKREHDLQFADEVRRKVRELVATAFENTTDTSTDKAEAHDMKQYIEDRRSGKRGPPKSRHGSPEQMPVPTETTSTEPESSPEEMQESVEREREPAKANPTKARPREIVPEPDAKALLEAGRIDGFVGSMLRHDTNITEKELTRIVTHSEGGRETIKQAYGATTIGQVRTRAEALVHHAYRKHLRDICGPDAVPDAPRLPGPTPKSAPWPTQPSETTVRYSASGGILERKTFRHEPGDPSIGNEASDGEVKDQGVVLIPEAAPGDRRRKTFVPA